MIPLLPMSRPRVEVALDLLRAMDIVSRGQGRAGGGGAAFWAFGGRGGGVGGVRVA